MKKLLYITPRIDGTGGLQRVLSIKATYLQDHFRYQITIATTNSRAEKPFYDFSVIRHLSRNLKGFGPFYFYSYVSLVRELVAQEQPDILIILDNGYKGFLLPYFLRNLPVKVVFEQHGFRFYESAEYSLSFVKRIQVFILRRLIDFSMSYVNQLVVLNHSSIKQWNHKKITVIPNPLWMVPQSTSVSKQNIVLAVGRHEHEKGYDLLISLWKRVVHNYPDWVLHIYGEENPDLRLEDLVISLGLTGQVVFKKPTLDIELAYAEASVFVMTSRHEGFGMALLEAMASGLPCVAYDCPTGPSALIEDHTSGFLIPMYEEGAFVEALQKLLSDSSLRKQMGNEGKRIASGYALDRVMSEWHQLFSSL